MELLTEFRLSVAGAAAMAAAGKFPHSEAADVIAVSVAPPHLAGHVPQTGSTGIVSEADGNCPDPKDAADRPWWAKLLDEEETMPPIYS